MWLILLSVLGPILAGFVIFLFVIFSSYMKGTENEKTEGLDPKSFLKLVTKAKVFPVASHNGWRLYSFEHSLRVWMQSFEQENKTEKIILYSSYTRMPASTQVVYQTIKDVTKARDWKPGIVICSQLKETISMASKTSPSHKHEHGMGSDYIKEIVIDKVMGESVDGVIPQNSSRYWNREENGCSWLLQTTQDNTLSIFYLMQPVEEQNSCTVTISTYNNRKNMSDASYVAALLGSLKDYLCHRRMQHTPLHSLKFPGNAYPSGKKVLTESSSEEEEVIKQNSLQRFYSLNTQQQNVILKKSENILRHRTGSLRRSGDESRKTQRSHSETDIYIPATKQPSEDHLVPILPKECLDSESQGLILDSNKNCAANIEGLAHDADSDVSNPDSGVHGDPHNSSFTHLNKKDEEEIQDMVLETDSDVSSISTASEDLSSNPDKALPHVDLTKTDVTDRVRYTTLANYCAADLLALSVKISNIDLRMPQSEQIEASGGWMFLGLESDVVLFKVIFGDSPTKVSYMGKGLIQASPRAVFDAVKNPRTRFTYDETLKKVDVLTNITSKTKIVYYFHELTYRFRKFSFDFCILQSERIDADKYVLAMQSVDNDTPVPAGVERLQMLKSGWIIEPVFKDNRVQSMATYVMQMDFKDFRSGMERQLLEELGSKQPMSIEYLRQYLRPAVLVSRQTSAISAKK